MATPYKVFRKVEAAEGNAAVTGGESWEVLALQEAGSGPAAIRKVVEKKGLTEGSFFATPERSFKPVTLKISQKLSLS